MRRGDRCVRLRSRRGWLGGCGGLTVRSRLRGLGRCSRPGGLDRRSGLDGCSGLSRRVRLRRPVRCRSGDARCLGRDLQRRLLGAVRRHRRPGCGQRAGMSRVRTGRASRIRRSGPGRRRLRGSRGPREFRRNRPVRPARRTNLVRPARRTGLIRPTRRADLIRSTRRTNLIRPARRSDLVEPTRRGARILRCPARVGLRVRRAGRSRSRSAPRTRIGWRRTDVHRDRVVRRPGPTMPTRDVHGLIPRGRSGIRPARWRRNVRRRRDRRTADRCLRDVLRDTVRRSRRARTRREWRPATARTARRGSVLLVLGSLVRRLVIRALCRRIGASRIPAERGTRLHVRRSADARRPDLRRPDLQRPGQQRFRLQRPGAQRREGLRPRRFRRCARTAEVAGQRGHPTGRLRPIRSHAPARAVLLMPETVGESPAAPPQLERIPLGGQRGELGPQVETGRGLLGGVPRRVGTGRLRFHRPEFARATQSRGHTGLTRCGTRTGPSGRAFRRSTLARRTETAGRRLGAAIAGAVERTRRPGRRTGS